MEFESQVIDKILEKVGKERFNKVVLKIYSSEKISELNFNQRDIEEMILPLSQLGIIKVEDHYFYERPDKDKTRYNLFSISHKGKSLVKSILNKLNLHKKVDFFVAEYPSKFLAFVIDCFFPRGNIYYSYNEEEYSNLLRKKELTTFLENFKKDVEKFICGFWVNEHTSKRAIVEPPALILLQDFVDLLKEKVLVEIVDREISEFELVNYVERFFLKPQAKSEWYPEFLGIIETEKKQKIWEDWSKKLKNENTLIEHVVLNSDKLRNFLAKKIEDIQNSLSKRPKEEELTMIFFKTLEIAHVQLNKSDRSDILTTCENRKDFSIFISTIYKIMHDYMHIKDETIDPIRCYFHHKKQDKQQEWYKMKFEEFCKDNLISFPPNDDEWRILKEKILERAITILKE